MLVGKYYKYRPEGVDKNGKKYPECWWYTVHGSKTEIEDYLDSSNTNVFLQPDGEISDQKTKTPMYYSEKPVGLNPDITWTEPTGSYKTGRYFASRSYQDTEDSFNRKQKPVVSQEPEPEQEAEIAPKPGKPGTSRGRKRGG